MVKSRVSRSSNDILWRLYLVYSSIRSGTPCANPQKGGTFAPARGLESLISWARTESKGCGLFQHRLALQTDVCPQCRATHGCTSCTVKPLSLLSTSTPDAVQRSRWGTPLRDRQSECWGPPSRRTATSSSWREAGTPQRHPDRDNLADLADLAALANACLRQSNHDPGRAAQRHAFAYLPSLASSRVAVVPSQHPGLGWAQLAFLGGQPSSLFASSLNTTRIWACLKPCRA